MKPKAAPILRRRGVGTPDPGPGIVRVALK